jgi:hypothetical protein
MPTKLRGEWLDKIRPSLIDGLKQIQVKNGMFLERGPSLALAMADLHIPKMSPVRKELERFVDEFPLLEFTTDTLDRELYDRDRYLAEVERCALTDLEGYENPESLADRLIEEFQTLPWDYLITLRLPEAISAYAPEQDFQVSDDIWLRRGSGALEELTPLKNLPADVSRRVKGNGLMSLMLGEGPQWEADAVYLQMNIKGFVPPYGNSQAFRIAVSRLKAFLGLWLATRVVQLKARTFGEPSKPDVIVHRKYVDGYKADNRLKLDGAVYSLLNRMEAYDNNGKVKDEAVKKQWFMSDLKSVAKVFQCGESAHNLVLAGQWVFDSYAGEDALLSYIRSMVVLEILLGSQKDGKELSIADLIGNRCAYLIGKDFKQRQDIMGDLKRIYAVRSQIVHRGKAQLSLEERTMLRRLQWIGQRVIQEEILRIPKSD